MVFYVKELCVVFYIRWVKLKVRGERKYIVLMLYKICLVMNAK